MKVLRFELVRNSYHVVIGDPEDADNAREFQYGADVPEGLTREQWEAQILREAAAIVALSGDVPVPVAEYHGVDLDTALQKAESKRKKDK